jgi:hypothetical protein
MMTHITADLDLCDAEVARLSAATDAIATTLVELDADNTRRLLDSGPLSGVTAQRWQAVQDRLSELWIGHQLLCETLTTAKTARGTSRRPSRDQVADLAATVFGNSIELSTASIPLTQRALLGPRQATNRCTPAQLLTTLEATFDQVRTVLSDVSQAWQWQLTRLASCESQRAILAADVDRPVSELLAADEALTELTSAVTADPLGTAPENFAAVEDALTRARAAIDSVRQLRDHLDDILTDGERLLTELTALRGELRSVNALATVKIAGYVPQPEPGSEPDLVREPDLATELAELRTLGISGDVSVGARLIAWQQRAGSARDQLRLARDAAQAPLAERAELRGRLEAYTAKTARFGIAESQQLTRMRDRARGLLYSAPCDLPAARRALAAYISAVIAATTPSRGGPG